MSIAAQIRADLEATHGTPNVGANSEDIALFQQRHQLSLPADFAELYQCMHGASFSNDALLELWPLDRVGTVPEVLAPFAGIPNYSAISSVLPDAGDFFAFADCLIWSQVLAVRLRPATADSTVVWICGSAYAQVASSFHDFCSLLLRDPDVVLWAKGATVRTGAA